MTKTYRDEHSGQVRYSESADTGLPS